MHLGKDPLVKKYDTSSLRMIGCGAAPLGREHIEAIDKQIGVGVKQGYVVCLLVPVFSRCLTRYLAME